MKTNEKSIITATPFSRRRFLALSTLASGIPLALSLVTAQCSGRKSGGTVIYSSGFIPDGALFKLAFVTDHHYWPDHHKNWGEKLFRNTEERMNDLVKTLNLENPDLSVHCGDVIDSGTAFEPPFDEYIRQLDYEKKFLNSLRHLAVPVIGNHEVPDARYEHESELDEWKKRFGPLHRFVDVKTWRLIFLNTMVPNPGERIHSGPVYGISEDQLRWLNGVLHEASSKSMNALLFAHIPPRGYTFQNDFERVIAESGCVRGIFCGHTHRNSRTLLGTIPVMVRASNVASPLAYTLIYPYPDGRLLVVQKSQHFPFLNYISDHFRSGLQGSEEDRYYTIGGSTELPMDHLTVIGENADAVIRNGHLTLRSEKGRGYLLVDTPELTNARLSFSAVKEGATHMGVVALASGDCSSRIEGVVTSEYGPDGNHYLAQVDGASKRTLGVSWFNIADGIAYEFIIEVRKKQVTMFMKNMPTLTALLGKAEVGRFGLFVDNGSMFVTDLTLEKLP